MRINIFISLLFVLFSFFNLNAQTYNYSYTDPCTGNIKNLIVPINGSVTVGYYGFVENFTQQQFTDGTFETWANQVFSQYDGSPCAEIVGLGGQINIGQDVALNTIGIINSLSSLMDISNGSTDFLSGSLNAASNSSNTKGSKGNKKNGNNSQNGSGNNTTNNSNSTTPNTNNTTTNNTQNQTNGTSNTTEGSQTTSGTNETSSNNGGNGTTNQNGGTQNPTPAGGTSTEGGSNANGNSQASQPINNQNTNTNENNSNTTVGSNTGESSGNGTSGNGEGNNQTNQEVTNNGSNGGGNSGVGNNGGNPPNGEETTTQTEEQGGGTNITQGATKTINQNREGGKPTVIASGDFVGFNFQNSEVKTGLKLTGGYHNMRWDGETARGGLVDYVSAQQGPNITGYHAWINKKSVGLLSGTLSVGFEGRGSVYGTLAGGQMFMFPKIPSLKAVYMGTVSYGQVYKTSFLGTALIGGGMYDLKFGKRIDVKLMTLFVYSPYVSYYNDLVLKSPYVILPSLGTNIAITKRFKFNINAGGAWAIKVNTLNYTITCGTRLLVGQ